MNQATLAGGLFLITYTIIVTERLHRTTAALLGGLLMILSGVLTQREAFLALDLNVIFLLAGMMMIAYILGETGVFQWLAVQAVRLGQGQPLVIMIIIAVITAVTSAALDNVTVVVLIAPVTLFVASALNVSPIPFLITSVMASNIGGAATLIGDPPNILIGSAAGIDFYRFLINMGPPAFLALLAYCGIIYFQFRHAVSVSAEQRRRVLRLETRGLIKDRQLLNRTLAVLGLVLLAFLFHGPLHLEPATIALGGATLLLISTRQDPHHALQHVEWTTLMFFVGLFITVEAIVKVGIIERVGQFLLEITGGSLSVTTLSLMWFSALASGIVDNIPYTATMIPVVESLAGEMPIEPLWWALALGADFGGNLTLVGASANLVAASLAERSGYPLTFGLFLRYGLLTVVVTLLIATAWMLIVYL